MHTIPPREARVAGELVGRDSRSGVGGVLLYGYLQSKFNKQRMPESPTPDGGIEIHWRWGIAAKATSLSNLCLGVAVLFAYFIPQALAQSEFVRNLTACG